MKKFIYGTIFVIAVFTAWIFFFNPPVVTNRVASTTIAITFRFPEGYEFTEGAPFTLAWQDESPDGKRSAPVRVRNFDPIVSPCELSLNPSQGSEVVVLTARLYYCDKSTRMCFQDDFQTRVPLVSGNATVIPWVWEIIPKKA